MSILDKHLDDIQMGSIVRFLYDIEPCAIYQDGLPEDFEIPSIYIPSPNIITENFSNDAYLELRSVQAKIFGASDAHAASHAQVITEIIRKNRDIIPMYDVDGNSIGRYLRFTKVEWRPIEDCVVNLSLEWSFVHGYNRITSEHKIREFNLSVRDKTLEGSD